MVKEYVTMNSFLSALKENQLSDNPFLTYEYYLIYTKHYPPKNIHVFVVYTEENEIVGIVPLVKKRDFYIFIGHRASNYLGYICREEDVSAVDNALKNYLSSKKEHFIINYYDINTESKLFSLLAKEKDTKNIFLYKCPNVDISNSFETLFRNTVSMSKKRAEIKKFIKKFDLVGNVDFININDKDTFLLYKLYIGQIFRVHEERFRNIFIPDAFCLYKNQSYYYDLIDSMVQKNQLLLSLLLIDEVVVSFVFALTSSTSVIDWMPAFDPAFAKYNMGTAHMKLLLEYLCDKTQYNIFDFSKGDGEYKNRWSTGCSQNHMFIRRFDDDFLTRIKCDYYGNLYVFKSYLREHGYLVKLKSFIVNSKKIFYCKNKKIYSNDPIMIHINEEGIIFDDIQPLSYKAIYQLSIEFRKAVLDEIYRGNKAYITLDRDNKVEKVIIVI